MRPELSRFRALDRLLASREPRTEAETGFSPAAVAVVCVPDPDAILLIRRAERAGDPWSGQMGLPGGRSGSEDADLLETAIRETAEEVGLGISRAQLVGVLDDLTPRTVLLPRIMVRPHVFLLEGRPPLIPNHEVAAAYWSASQIFDFAWLRQALDGAGGEDYWERRAVESLSAELDELRRELARQLLTGGGEVTARVATFRLRRAGALERIRALLDDLRSARTVTLAAIMVLVRELGRLEGVP